MPVGDIVTSPICPHCGFNLRADEPVTAGPFAYDPRAGISFEGQPLPIAKKAQEIVAALMTARGRVLTIEVLTERVSPESSSNTVAAQLSMAKAALRERGLSLPIENIPGRGWRWAGPIVASRETTQ